MQSAYNVINLTYMEDYKGTHEHSKLEDRIADLLVEDLIPGSYDYEMDDASIHVQIATVKTGQHITVQKFTPKEIDKTIISVAHAEPHDRPIITALHTKTFVDGDHEPLMLSYYPDAVGRIRDNLGISNLAMIIELAIMAQRQEPKQP